MSERLIHKITSAAKLLDVSRATVYSLINDGRLKTVDHCGITSITDDELRRYVASLKPRDPKETARRSELARANRAKVGTP